MVAVQSSPNGLAVCDSRYNLQTVFLGNTRPLLGLVMASQPRVTDRPLWQLISAKELSCNRKWYVGPMYLPEGSRTQVVIRNYYLCYCGKCQYLFLQPSTIIAKHNATIRGMPIELPQSHGGTHFVQLLRVYCFNRPGEHYIVDVENDRNANRSIINIILLSVKWRIKLLTADEFPSNKVACLYWIISCICHITLLLRLPMLRVVLGCK